MSYKPRDEVGVQLRYPTSIRGDILEKTDERKRTRSRDAKDEDSWSHSDLEREQQVLT